MNISDIYKKRSPEPERSGTAVSVTGETPHLLYTPEPEHSETAYSITGETPHLAYTPEPERSETVVSVTGETQHLVYTPEPPKTAVSPQEPVPHHAVRTPAHGRD